jgi:hypothetical protein
LPFAPNYEEPLSDCIGIPFKLSTMHNKHMEEELL